MDARFAEDGWLADNPLEALPKPILMTLLWTGVLLLPGPLLLRCVRDVGPGALFWSWPPPFATGPFAVPLTPWKYFTVVDRGPFRLFAISPPLKRLLPSMDERAELEACPSEAEAALGRRRDVVRPRPAPYSGSKGPGPTDFLGGLLMLLLETGG